MKDVHDTKLYHGLIAKKSVAKSKSYNVLNFVDIKQQDTFYWQCQAKFCWRMLEKCLRNICSWR